MLLSPYLRTAGGLGDRSGRQVRRLYFGKQDHRSTVTCHDIRNQFRVSDPDKMATLVGEGKCQ